MSEKIIHESTHHVFVELGFVLFSFGDGGVVARKQFEMGFDGRIDE